MRGQCHCRIVDRDTLNDIVGRRENLPGRRGLPPSCLSDARKVSCGFRACKEVVDEDRAQIRDIPSKVLHDMGCEVHHFSCAGRA
jgi:hypothetical protein